MRHPKGPQVFIIATSPAIFSERDARFQNKENGAELQQFKASPGYAVLPSGAAFEGPAGISSAHGSIASTFAGGWVCKTSEQGQASQLRPGTKVWSADPAFINDAGVERAGELSAWHTLSLLSMVDQAKSKNKETEPNFRRHESLEATPFSTMRCSKDR